jgi:hypothetical protein
MAVTEKLRLCDESFTRGTASQLDSRNIEILCAKLGLDLKEKDSQAHI